MDGGVVTSDGNKKEGGAEKDGERGRGGVTEKEVDRRADRESVVWPAKEKEEK